MRYLFLFLFCFGLMAAEQSKTINQLSGTATTTSTLVLPFNINRNELIVVNKGLDTMIVRTGSADASQGLPIPAGGNYDPDPVPIDSIYLKIISGTGNYQIHEGNKL